MAKVLLVCVTVLLLGAIGASGQMKLGSTSPQDVKELAKAQSEYDSAKKAFHHHNTAKTKQSFLAATDRYAMTSMLSPVLSPKIKYRQALRLYREALKIDPTNREAKSNSDTIISIYKSMHRPVPSG